MRAVARSPIPRGTLYYRPQSPAYGLNVARARGGAPCGRRDGRRAGVRALGREGLPASGAGGRRVDRGRHAPGRPQAEGRHVGRRRAGQRHLQREGHRRPVPHQLVQQRRPDDRIPGLQPGVRVVLGRQDGRAPGRRPGRARRTRPRAGGSTNSSRRRIWRQAWHVPLYNSDFTVAHTRTLQGLRVLKNFSTHFYSARLT